MANKPLLVVIASIVAVVSSGSFLALDALPSKNPLSPSVQDASTAAQAAAQSPQTQTAAQSPPTQAATPPSIEGAWILAKWGGEDGLSRCSDYVSPVLYKRNDDMGEVAQFAPDGTYKALFAYTTPGGEEHSTQYSATWQQDQSKLALLNFVAEDAFRNESPHEDRSLVFSGVNVVLIDAQRYARCIGDTGL